MRRCWNKRAAAALIATAASQVGLSIAPAGTLYLDTNGTTSGFGATATATWNASTTPNWTPDNTGATGQGVWTQAGGQDVAVLDQTGMTAGTITISGTVNANEIQNAVNGESLSGGILNLTGQATVRTVNALFISSVISGSVGLKIESLTAGIVTLSGSNNYTGDTTINSVIRVGANNTMPTATRVIDNGQLNLNGGFSQQIAGISGVGRIGSASLFTPSTLVLSATTAASGTQTFTGTWATVTSITSIVKDGTFTEVFGGAGDSTSTGSLTVKGGTFALARTSGHDGVAGPISLTTGTSGRGTLRLDAANQVKDGTPLTLDGGIFNSNGFSDIFGNATNTGGTLSVLSNSDIDFGGGASLLTFASASRTAGVLTIDNWSGTQLFGGGTDQLRVTTLPSASFLDNIQFAGYALPGAMAVNFGTYFEIIPVPEPGCASLLILTGAVSIAGRRRITK
jgi:hypothetical protein